MSRVRFLQIFQMMHVGNDTTEASNPAIKGSKKVHGVIEYTEKQFQKLFSLYALVAPTFSSKTARLAPLQVFKIPSRPGCGNFSKCDNRKGLIIL
jgi:hypothetical protein